MTRQNTKKATVPYRQALTVATTFNHQQEEKAMSDLTLIDRAGVDMIDSIHGYYWDDLFGEYMVKVDLIDSKGQINRGCIAADDLMITEEIDDEEEPEPAVTRAQLEYRLADALIEADFDALDDADLILLVGILGRHSLTAQQSCKDRR